MFSRQQLFTKLTDEEWLQDTLDYASGTLGYPIDNLKPTSMMRLMFFVASHAAAQCSQQQYDVAKYNFLETAEGDALTTKCSSDFGIDRIEGIAAQGIMRFQNAEGEGPTTINIGEMTVAIGDQTFTNNELFVVPVGSGSNYQTGSMTCNSLGTIGNVASNSTITNQSQFVNITVTNPNRDDTSSLLTPGWLSVLGQDEENDDDLKTRARLWLTEIAGLEFTADRIKQRIVNATSGTIPYNRIVIDDQAPRGPGTFDVYQAQALAASTSQLNATALGSFSGSMMSGSSGRGVVYSAPTQNMDVSMTIFYDPIYTESTVDLQVQNAINTYIKNIPPGGSSPNITSTAKTFRIDDFQKLILNATGVEGLKILNFCGKSGAVDGNPESAFHALVEGTTYIEYIKKI